jgi:hypothetical protein
VEEHGMLQRPAVVLAWTALAALSLGGCVKKTLTIDSEPQGALVEVNGIEVGRTPVTVPFTWYGSYEIVLRKDGYETLEVDQRVWAPPHQWIGVDLITECLLPVEFKDEKSFKYELDEAKPVDRRALIQRGEELQQRALRGS